MADEAHDWTDKQIEALQRKFSHVYSEAAKEMREKLERHMEAYEKKNAEWKSRVASGVVEQQEYDEWRRKIPTNRKFMSGMVNRLSTDATAANQKAIDLINDRIPKVYAENANHAAYQVEKGLGWDTHSFDLYDESTVRRLLTATDQDQIIHEVIPVGPPRPKWQDLRVDLDRAKDVRWNRQKFTSAITQSILQGESIPDTAKRLMRVLNMDRGMATRAARTAMTSAENAGRVDSYKRAKRIGINLEQEWMATLDERTRYSHRELDGQHVPVGGKFVAKSTGHELEFPADPKAHPSETYNCFVEGTLACSDTAIERSYRHEYSGKLVTIKTASGIEFTCTPNHPILTMNGWVAANFLHEGDNLCIARIGDSRLSGVNPDVNHIQSSMEAIHNLLALHASKRVAGSNVNFHGDIPATDVEIVGEKGTLRFDVETSRGEDITELPLELSDSTGLRFCPTCESVGSVMTPSTGNLCSKSIFPSLLRCQFAHPHVHGIRTTAPFDPSIAEHPSDNIAGMPDAFGDSFLGVATEIGVDYIVNVEITHTRGTHVYNLQTESGYYFVGSKNTDNVIIAHNCRCTLVAWLPGIEQEDPERWSRLPKGMTYDEWKHGKKQEQKEYQYTSGSSPIWGQLGDNDPVAVRKKVDQMLQGSAGSAAKVWQKYESQLKLFDPEGTDGDYFMAGRGVSVHLANDMEGKGVQGNVMGVFFHEFGHHIDNIVDNVWGASNTYGRGKDEHGLFSNTLVKEVSAALERKREETAERLEAAIKNIDIDELVNIGAVNKVEQTFAIFDVKYYLDLLDDDYVDMAEEDLKLSLSALSMEERRKAVFDYYRKNGLSISMPDESELGYQLGLDITHGGHDMQVALGDIYEGATKGVVYDTCGHGSTYWGKGNDSRLAEEAFAEFFSAECIYSENPKVLDIMKEYLPESYSVYREIMESIL